MGPDNKITDKTELLNKLSKDGLVLQYASDDLKQDREAVKIFNE